MILLQQLVVRQIIFSFTLSEIRDRHSRAVFEFDVGEVVKNFFAASDLEEIPDFHQFAGFSIPENKIVHCLKTITSLAPFLFNKYFGHKIISSKYFIHYRSNAMGIFIADLHKDGASLG